ncbi:MAG TPA: DEAD/DEAH box helicase, partial [Erysipelothrix sp.]|nr:DEAD/DEAH box helicase [Erysipelothrix sp.]
MKEKTFDLLKINNFKNLTKVQEDVLNELEKDRDLIVLAPTGTGKTHAFLFSILERVNFNDTNLQAIILSPTRELAMQTFDFSKKILEVEPKATIDLAIG